MSESTPSLNSSNNGVVNSRTPTPPIKTDGIHLAAKSGDSEAFTDTISLSDYVTPDHWQARKACIVFQASCLVSMMSCMSKATNAKNNFGWLQFYCQ